MNFNENYFVFHDETIENSKNIRFSYNVKTKKEWEKLGFIIKLTDLGQPLNGKKTTYRFSRAKMEDPEIIAAVKTGKKGTTNPLIVSKLYQQGIDFAEFIELPESVKLYCQADILNQAGDYLAAFPLIEKCVSLKNENGFCEWECRYRELYYSIGRKLLKTELISDELNYLENDMDTFRYESWGNVLLKLRQYDMITPMLTVVKDGFSKLIKNTIPGKRIYCAQNTDYYKHGLEKVFVFEQKINETKNKYELSKDKEIKSDAVNKIIYDFMQESLPVCKNNQKIVPEQESKIFSLMYEDRLTAAIIAKLNYQEKCLLSLLLTQYVMFFSTHGKELTFPSWFLQKKRKGSIPFNILHYIELHKWPYPQMLKR